ncbi:S8 family serine peptidase [Tengunoibacter tsumagoiensis]|uniref:Peptidase S8/S53 domain-containing protein n=1 Tax=Tengunoibacter tsumagoiensis TaxID=2014871 RepID=A0A402A696_9CHLR|nr:S8 family serine peptidase [Tengunoibacter tsumagoiensis]GCE14652.1 hypothetical protein KTT_45110 [Tengunoibacter tsumagoiensis]
MKIVPAWSAQFAEDALRTVDPLPPLEDSVTWEGVFGNSTGKGVRVAVIDSGIDSTHPAFDKGVSGYVAIHEDNGSILYDTEPHEDVFGHGTACAGIIRSIAPDCELYSVRVLGSALIGRGSTFMAGLRWAVENNMHVCNLSLGTTKKEFYASLHEIADKAYFNNVLLVAAANNLPIPSFPSMYSSVISVAADQQNEYDMHRFFYNPAPPVEFGAPGIEVRVPWQNHSWIMATGNSFAAPHITGMIASILGKHPGITPFQVKSLLRSLSANSTVYRQRGRSGDS